MEATAAAARRGGAFFNQKSQALDTTGSRFGTAIKDAGEVAVKYEDHRQISAGAAAFSKLEEGTDREWNARVNAEGVDPNDPSVAGGFREQTLEPRLQQFLSGFTTENSRRWAEAHADRYREHMFHKTAADIGTLAKAAVDKNISETLNAQTNRVYSDPGVLDDARTSLTSSIEGQINSSPTMTAAQVAAARKELFTKGNEQLVKGAVLGAIEKGGDWQSIANKKENKPYINVAEMEMFAKRAKSQERADLYYQKATEQYEKTQNVHAADQAYSKTFTDNVSFDETGKATIKPGYFKEVMKTAGQPDAPMATAKAMINWAQAQQREKRESIVTDKGVYNDLIARVADPSNPTTEAQILQAAAEDKLDGHHTQAALALRKSIQHGPLVEPVFQEKLKAVQGMLGVGVVPDGHDKYSNFLQQFIKPYLALPESERAAAIDTSNPNSLISKVVGSKPGEGLRPTEMEMRMGAISSMMRKGGFDMSGVGVPSGPAPSVGERRQFKQGWGVWDGKTWVPEKK